MKKSYERLILGRMGKGFASSTKYSWLTKDDTPTRSLIIGATRSGMSDTLMLPMIDICYKEKQNDPEI